MSDRRPITMELAGWIAAMPERQLPEEVIVHLRRSLLDYSAAVVAGSPAPAPLAVRAYLDAEGESGSVSIVGSASRASARDAALANGTAAHALEVDDGYTPGGLHPGATVTPAVLAAAEREGSSCTRFFTALSAGLEVACRLGAASHPQAWRRGFHNTALAGTVGAACGVACLLDADRAVAADAIALAASHAGGLFEFVNSGGEVKRLHAGKAARDGLVCADLALRGVSGPVTALEGSRGYMEAFAGGEYDESLLTEGLGTRWELLRTYLKPYPCCRHLHGPVEAALELSAERRFAPAEIDAVAVRTYEVAARHSATEVEGLIDAQMSIPFAVAVALCDGAAQLEQFGAANREDAQLRELCRRVEVRAAPELTARYPSERPAELRVRLRAGGSLAASIGVPYGEPDRPLSTADLMAKFEGLCEPAIGRVRCHRVATMITQGFTPSELAGALRFEQEAEDRLLAMD